MKNINLTSNSCVGCGVSLKLESILMSPNRRPETFADKFPIINRSENLYDERKVPFQNNHPISTPLQLRYLKKYPWMHDALGQAKFLGILESNSTIEFDPKHDSISIFGSLRHCFTTTREL